MADVPEPSGRPPLRYVPPVVKPTHPRARAIAAIGLSVALLGTVVVTVISLLSRDTTATPLARAPKDGAVLAAPPPALAFQRGEHRKLPSACDVVPLDVTMCLGKGGSALRDGAQTAERKTCRWSPDRRARPSSRVYRMRYELFNPDQVRRTLATEVARREFGVRRAAVETSRGISRIGDESYMEMLDDGSARVVARHRNVIVTSDFQQGAVRGWSDLLVFQGTVNAAKAAVREL